MSTSELLDGTANDDLLVGGNGKDTLQGGVGDDTLYGGNGTDTLYGGDGSDLLDGGNGADLLDGGAGSDTINAGAGNDTVIHTLAENGGSLDIYRGGAGSDTLRLELTGSEWADEAIADEILAYVDFLASGSGASFTFATIHLTVSGFEALVIVVDGVEIDLIDEFGIIDLGASTQDETVTQLGGGSYHVTTGSGSDTITLGIGDDTVFSGLGDDLITIGDGDDVVHSGGGNDTVVAGSGGGDDLIEGGDGRDTVTYPSIIGALLIDLGAGFATGAEIGNDTLVSVEDATGGAGNDTIIGDDSVNHLAGAAGDDSISGAGGSDRLFGDEGNDILYGGDGGDLLYGGIGYDTVNGGAGLDTLILDGGSTDYEIVNLGAGQYQITDTRAGGNGVDVFSSIDQIVFDDLTLFAYELPGSSEIHGSFGNDILNGTEGADAIFGGAGDDTLLGYGGSDFLVGGAGNDLFLGGDADPWDGVWYLSDVYAGGNGGIIADLNTGIVIDPFGYTDTLIEIENIAATNLNDYILGSDRDEAFDHFGGNDTIEGGDGYDVLYNDRGDSGYRGIEVVFSTTVEGTGVIEVDSTGSRDIFTGIEQLAASDWADVILGGAGQQGVYDGDGADLLDGGAGDDVLDIGGTGDVYLDMEDLASESEVAEFASATFAPLDPETAARLSVDLGAFYFYTDGFGNIGLARGFETVVLYRGADDTLLGDGGDNSFFGFAGEDLLDGREGDDNLTGGLGTDSLLGSSGNDRLFGDDGNDILIGGTGADQLSGGFGVDEFRFSAGDGADAIVDFVVGADVLILIGQFIDSTSELDVDGDGVLDSRVLLSSGDTIDLLFVSGISDVNTLLVA